MATLPTKKVSRCVPEVVAANARLSGLKAVVAREWEVEAGAEGDGCKPVVVRSGGLIDRDVANG